MERDLTYLLQRFRHPAMRGKLRILATVVMLTMLFSLDLGHARELVTTMQELKSAPAVSVDPTATSTALRPTGFLASEFSGHNLAGEKRSEKAETKSAYVRGGEPQTSGDDFVDPGSAMTLSATEAFAARVTRWDEMVRDRMHETASAISAIPTAVSTVISRLQEDALAHDFSTVSLLVAASVIVCLPAIWTYRPRRLEKIDYVREFLLVAAFSLLSTIAFFAVDWPPLCRVVGASFIAAYICHRLTAIAVDLAAHPELHFRLKLVSGLVFIGVATVVATTLLEVAWPVQRAIIFVGSSLLLASGIELTWNATQKTLLAKIGLTFYLVALWLLWFLELHGPLWIGIYFVTIPALLRGVGLAVRNYRVHHAGLGDTDVRTVLLVRGSRAVVIAIAVVWIGFVWGVESAVPPAEGLRFASLYYGILRSVIVVLVADIVWHVARAFIDRHTLPPSDGIPGGPSPGSHPSRLLTLLPILRNVVAVVLFLTAGMIVMSQIGVEIAPLIAGAGVIGIAIGFGSQSLVRDVMSGFFYLFDDAFRVGEYIQAKTYKGTVEGFSLRSVRLRHHRGPIFTIPFGELGAVENMSRDWAKAKFRLTVAYDTDLEKARKVAKAIGERLLEDPEFGSVFIQPLKMKGVEDFSDYGIVVSFAMVTIPTTQLSFIRRKANAMLHEAFQEHGIVFAQPVVNVRGGDALDAAQRAAGAAMRPGASAAGRQTS